MFVHVVAHTALFAVALVAGSTPAPTSAPTSAPTISNENDESDPCECYDEWEYMNETYYMCDMTSDWNTSWCYVQGGTECDVYEDSLYAGETRKWRECNMTEDVNGDEDENDNENENDDSTSAPTIAPTSAPTSASTSASTNAPTSAPTIADENDTTTTTTVATVSGSFTLSTASGNKDTLCQASNLAVGGKTYEIVLEAFNKSGVSVKDIVTLTLFCPETTLLRERRLQEESFEISFEVTFAETSSADTFSNALTEAATDVESYFESLVSETFNFSVSATVTVTEDDDNAGENSGVVGKVALVGASCVLSVMGFLM